MKKYMYLAVAALAMTFAACSSSDDDSNGLSISFVKPADFALYSNGQLISSTFGSTRGYGEAATPVDILANIFGQKGNVETNLSLMTLTSGEDTDAEATYYTSKLSVHVRAVVGTTTVTLPVPAQFWANVRNQEDWEDFSTEINTALIKMNAEYAAPVDGHNMKIAVSHASDAITVTLSGVTQEILDYCKATYGDNNVNCGMTFEIWNYYDKKTATVNDVTINLQDKMNTSTIAFETAPQAYINSFGKTYNFTTGKYSLPANPDDCTVKATGSNVSSFTQKTNHLELQNSLYDLYTTDAFWTAVEAEINAAANYDK